MDDFEIIGHIVVDDAGTISIQRVGDELDNVAKKAGGAGTAFATLGKAALAGVAAVGVALAGLVGGVTLFADQSLKAASDHQATMAQLDNVLANTAKSFSDAAASSTKYAATGDRVVTVTAGSSKEILKAKDALDKAQVSLTKANLSWADHNKHTQLAGYNLSLAQQKVGDLQAKYDSLTKTFTVHAGAVDTSTRAIDKNAAALTMTKQQLTELAKATETNTVYSQDSALAAETVLLQYDKIGKDVFPQAMQATADLATRMGVDLPQAATVVARALADPVMGIGRLNQQYKLFEPTQLKAIEQMALHGKTAQAQGEILAALSTRVGGSAAAAAMTYAGAVQQMGNAWEDLKIAVGTAALPVMTLVTHVMTQATELATTVLTPILEGVSASLQPYLDKISTAVKHFTDNYNLLISAGVRPDIALKSAWDAHGKEITDAVEGLLNFILSAVNTWISTKWNDFAPTIPQRLLDFIGADIHWGIDIWILPTLHFLFVDLPAALRKWWEDTIATTSNMATITAMMKQLVLDVNDLIKFDWGNFLARFIADLGQNIWTALTKNPITAPLTELLTFDWSVWIANFGQDLWAGILKGISDLEKSPFIVSIDQFLNLHFPDMGKTLSDWFTRGVHDVQTWLAGDGSQLFVDVGNAIGDLLSQGLPKLATAIIKAALGGLQAIVTVLDAMSGMPLVGPEAAALSVALKAAMAAAPAKAMGGPVTRGEIYKVGERGPEWFVPDRDGTILPSGVNPSTVTSNQTTNNYYFGGTLYQSPAERRGALAQSFRKA